MEKIPCDLCGAEGEWNNILRTTAIQKKDGSDIIVCNDCLSDWIKKDFETILRRAVKNGWLTIER